MKNKILLAIALAAIVGGFLWFRNNKTDSSGALIGPRWVWQETQMNDGSVLRPTKPGEYALVFNQDNTVFGDTDCNNFSGDYSAGEGNTLTFGPFMSTLMFCEGSQETEFSQAVSESNQFIFTPVGDLVLLIKFDSGSVIFKKE
jgi:heat shock protein HslJ